MRSVEPIVERIETGEALHVCASCGNSFSGRYCNRCGEKSFEPNEKSLGFSFFRFLNSLLSGEGKIVRTAKLMVLHTGEFSVNYMNGVRVKYLKPVSVFLFVNLLYFLFPVFQGFDTPLRTQMHFLPHNELARDIVQRKVEENGTTLADYTVRFEQHSSSLSRLLLIFYVVISAFAILFVNFSSRLYFFDHLAVSFEFNSLFIFITQLALPWIFTAVVNLIGPGAEWLMNDIFYPLLVAVAATLLFYLFEKRVYEQDNRTAWIKSVVMLPALFIALQVYRIVLFFVTVATL